MSVILGFAELLETLELGPERRSSAQRRISDAARHVISLVDDVLDIAKIEGGAAHLVPEQIPVADLVAEVVALLDPLAARRQIALEATGGDGALVVADRRRTRQILLNVINNAVKYNRHGGRVEITVAVDGDDVVLAVADEGPGFAGHPVERIFEPFDRLGAEHSQVQGSGLGLPLSRSLAEAMGGALRLLERPGAGAVVEITLPGAGTPA
jgi:signal transduction histidine kinase